MPSGSHQKTHERLFAQKTDVKPMYRSSNIRIGLLVFLAVSVSLPMAFVSLGKALLFVAGMYYLARQMAITTRSAHERGLSSVWVVLICISAWAFSLLLTGASQEQALIAFVKHGKLLIIPLLIVLIRTHKEARYGVIALLLGQTIVLLSSWLMAMDISIPWVARPSGPGSIETQFIPYADSYLDQSVMLATSAGILWHLSYSGTWRWARLLSIAGVLNVVSLMPGRTGYVLAIATACLIAIYELPVKWRIPTTIFTPLVLAVALFYSVPQFQQRVSLAIQELSNYERTPDNLTSVGARLNMWKLSLEAIAHKPILGYGIGNWTPVIKRRQGPDAETVFGTGNGSNPHQELLLWSVELGVIGALLFLALFVALLRDARQFEAPQRHACQSLLIMLAITCLFNSPLYDDLLGDYFCVAMGLLMALGLRDNPDTLETSTRTG